MCLMKFSVVVVSIYESKAHSQLFTNVEVNCGRYLSSREVNIHHYSGE